MATCVSSKTPEAVEILLANPRGFCAGVDRAIEIVERALESFGAPVYVRHEVVHNKYVVNMLKEKGAVFVEELDEIPDGAVVVFSAHGVSKQVRANAAQRNLRVFDAICPLVTKVHMEVGRYQNEGRECVLIGHAGHPEVEGTLGQYTKGTTGGMYLVESVEDVERMQVNNPKRLAYVTQTTLSIDDTREIIAALRRRFPDVVGPKKDDICYATQNRQDAVKKVAAECDLMLVVGSQNSSNSTRLKEISQKLGVTAYLIDRADEIDPEWLVGRRRIGITAGASAPEVLVQDVIQKLHSLLPCQVRENDGTRENVTFSLPRELAPGRDDVPA